MKKFICSLVMGFALFAIAPAVMHTNEAESQIVTTLTPTAAKDTLTNTDTAYIYISTAGGSVSTGVADNISRSATLHVTRVSGTVAGTARLEGSNNAGSDWELIDTAYTLTNSASQVYTLPLRASNGDLLFKQFRWVVYMSGTQVVIPKVYYMRRSN